MHILHLLNLGLVILLQAYCSFYDGFLLDNALLLLVGYMVEVVYHVQVLLLHFGIFFFAGLEVIVALS